MIYAVAFISGAALMGLEMVGSRILAPVFGSSIFVWGSLIGVVLTALSVGYYTGGYLADRHPSHSPLSALLALSGAWIAFVPAVSGPVLARLSAASGVGGPLLASFALFLPPSVLLAMVSPWCMRLLIPSVERAGHSAGLLYAVSNAGSIAGTFATSFYLIPRMGTSSILRLAAGLLLALSVATALRRGLSRAAAVVAAGALVVTLLGGLLHTPAAETGVVHRRQSLYHDIYVVDQGRVRLLRFDNAVQGGMYRDKPYDSAYPYPDYLHLALTMKADIEDVLMIGLGAGLCPKRFHHDYPDMNVEVVEIDPAVVLVAREYFGFPADEVKVYVKDGRVYLAETEKTYDLIIVDAYYADAIPFHLATVEFYEAAKARLKPGGILASNMIGALEGERSSLFRSMYLTMARVFPATYVFAVDYRPLTEASYRNIEVFAVAPTGAATGTESPRLTRADFVARARALAKGTVTIQDYADLAADLYEKPVSREGAVLLTDDHAPVDALLHIY